MTRCQRCILPESYPKIRFDSDGVCNYCLSYEKRQYYGESKLIPYLESFKRDDSKYDAIVGVSGGRDSSFALYYVAKVAKMKVLAYTIDTGLVTEQAKINMREMTDRLGVDLYVEKKNLDACFKKNVTAWMCRPAPRMLFWTCMLCNYGIITGLLEKAKHDDIPLVVTGHGGFEGSTFKEVWAKIDRNNRLKTLFAASAVTAYDLVTNPRYFANLPWALREINASLYMHTPLKSITNLKYKGITTVALFDYIEFDEHRIHSVIEHELGWQKSSQVESGWRMDCKLAFLKNYLYYAIFGFSEKDDFLSKMIREGLITRDEALKRIEKENKIPEECIVDLFNEYNLDYSHLKASIGRLKV